MVKVYKVKPWVRQAASLPHPARPYPPVTSAPKVFRSRLSGIPRYRLFHFCPKLRGILSLLRTRLSGIIRTQIAHFHRKLLDMIRCPSCARQGKARICHYKVSRLNLFFNRRRKHLCSHCGTVLNVTGGGLNTLGMLFSACMMLYVGTSVTNLLYPSGLVNEVFSFLLLFFFLVIVGTALRRLIFTRVAFLRRLTHQSEFPVSECSRF